MLDLWTIEILGYRNNFQVLPILWEETRIIQFEEYCVMEVALQLVGEKSVSCHWRCSISHCRFRRPQPSCRTLLLLLLDEKWLERALLACGLAISFSCLCRRRRRRGDNKSYIVCLPEAAKEGRRKEGRKAHFASN